MMTVQKDLPRSDTTTELTARLALLMADRLTLPPDSDRLRQIFNTAAELRRCHDAYEVLCLMQRELSCDLMGLNKNLLETKLKKHCHPSANSH